MKKIIFIILCLTYFNISFAGCFPNYTVYEINNEKKVYVKLEGIYQTLLEGPIYSINNINKIGSDNSCGNINISEVKKLSIFDFSFKEGVQFTINFIILILFIFLVPFGLLNYMIYKSKTASIIKIINFILLFLLFGIIFIWYFSYWI